MPERRRGRKEDWVGRILDISKLLRKFHTGQWRLFEPKSPVINVLDPIGMGLH